MLDTIKSSEEISLIFDKGRRFNTPYLTLIVLRNEEQHGQHGRVAFIAGKKQGNAVWRNRAKRRMRSICGEINGNITGYQIVYLAKQKLLQEKYDVVLGCTEECMRMIKEKVSGE